MSGQAQGDENRGREYRLASIHKIHGLGYATVSDDHRPMVAAAVRRGMTHPAIATNWLECRVDGSGWKRVHE